MLLPQPAAFLPGFGTTRIASCLGGGGRARGHLATVRLGGDFAIPLQENEKLNTRATRKREQGAVSLQVLSLTLFRGDVGLGCAG